VAKTRTTVSFTLPVKLLALLDEYATDGYDKLAKEY
jgi:hypothetical protein